MAAISFRLETFEGPLDLLLHLVSKHKLNIYDIEISLLLEQYLDYMSKIETQDYEQAADFLEMAARLIYIKTCYLLPKPEEGDELKKELEGRMIEYSLCRLAAQKLREKYAGSSIFVRKAVKLPVNKTYSRTHDVSELYNAYMSISSKVKEYKPLRANMFSPIVAKKIVSVESKITQILELLYTTGSFGMDKLYEGMKDRSERIAAFLAVLELTKSGRIALNEDNTEVTLRRDYDPEAEEEDGGEIAETTSEEEAAEEVPEMTPQEEAPAEGSPELETETIPEKEEYITEEQPEPVPEPEIEPSRPKKQSASLAIPRRRLMFSEPIAVAAYAPEVKEAPEEKPETAEETAEPETEAAAPAEEISVQESAEPIVEEAVEEIAEQIEETPEPEPAVIQTEETAEPETETAAPAEEISVQESAEPIVEEAVEEIAEQIEEVPEPEPAVIQTEETAEPETETAAPAEEISVQESAEPIVEEAVEEIAEQIEETPEPEPVTVEEEKPEITEFELPIVPVVEKDEPENKLPPDTGYTLKANLWGQKRYWGSNSGEFRIIAKMRIG